jgi:gephyrin
MDGTLKPAILVVSDTAALNPASDKTVDALAPVLAAEGKWEAPVVKIVRDDVLDIQRAVCDWTDGSNWVNLVLLTGGTGFAVKDNTPEVRSFLSLRLLLC